MEDINITCYLPLGIFKLIKKKLLNCFYCKISDTNNLL